MRLLSAKGAVMLRIAAVPPSGRESARTMAVREGGSERVGVPRNVTGEDVGGSFGAYLVKLEVHGFVPCPPFRVGTCRLGVDADAPHD